MKFGFSFLAICLALLLLLGQSPAEAKSLRRTEGQQRKLEDYYNNAADDAVQGDDAAKAGDDAVQEEEQQEEEEEEEEEQDGEENNNNNAEGQYDASNSGFDNESTGEGMFDTSPRNWGGLEWFLVTAVFLAWGALTSCFCDAWWCCSCFKAAEQKIYENRKLPSVIKDPVNDPAEYAAM